MRIFDKALCAFLFLSPIFLFKTIVPSTAKAMFFVVATFVLFALSLSIEPKRKLKNKWLGIIVLLALLRTFFDGGVDDGIEWFNFWMSFAGFIYILCGALLFYVVYSYADSNIKKYLVPIVVVCALNAILAISQAFGIDFMWKYSYGICGFMEAKNQLGQYSAMVAPLVFFVHPALVIIPLITLLMCPSFSSLICFMVVLFIFMGFSRAPKIPYICMILICLSIALLNYPFLRSQASYKPQIWARTLQVALQRPYLGHGYRTFDEKVVKMKGDTIGAFSTFRSQNDYLHTAQELGFPILIATGMFLLCLWKKIRAIKNKKRVLYCLGFSVSVILLNMFFQPVIRYASISGTFIVLLAFLFIKGENNG